MAAEVADDIVERRRFDFVRCLGRGGFGEVYLATMTSASGVRAEVAVKVLHEIIDPASQAVQRLRDEAHLLAALRHPAILRVFDLVSLEGRVALVTEYVDGGDIDQGFSGSDPMPLPALLECVGAVADALDAAWKAPAPDGGALRLVHRDIKPANIRIGRHGEVKLLDFGIARATNVRREARTQTNVMVGSLLYMAPERLDDEAPLDPRGDVFALGCTLYEGLVGERLFGELSMQKQLLVSSEAERYAGFLHARMGRLGDVPPAVAELLRDLLAYDPDARPDAADTSRRCEELARRAPGRSLRNWCRERTWPAPEAVPGQLDGRSVTEASIAASRASLAGRDEVTTWTRNVRDPDPTASGTRSSSAQPSGAAPAPREVRSVETLARAADPPPPPRGYGILMAGSGLLVGGLGTAVALALLVAGALLSQPTVDGDEPPAPIEAQVEPAPAPPEAPIATEPEPPSPPVEDVAPRRARAAPEPPPPPAKPLPAIATDTPKPAPPAPAAGTVEVTGGVAIELRRGALSFKPGLVPAGSWELWADFGAGLQAAGSVEVPAAGRVLLKCSRLRQTCGVER